MSRWVHVAVGLCSGVIVALAVWGAMAMAASDKRNAREERNDFQTANTICGTAPRSIKTHGPSWSYGPWLEVTCSDGSTRAVR